MMSIIPLPKSGLKEVLIWGSALVGFTVSGWALLNLGGVTPNLIFGALHVSLLAALSLVVAGVVFRALRLRVFAAALGESIRFDDSVRITLIDDLASGISPGRVAGEPARWVALRQLGISRGCAGSILAGEFVSDILVIVSILAGVGLLHLTDDSLARQMKMAWPSLLSIGLAPLALLFLLGYLILNHLPTLTAVLVALLRRVPEGAPFVGPRKESLEQKLTRAARATDSRLRALIQCGKRPWILACAMGLGHGITRLAILPAVAWSLHLNVDIVSLLSWQCAVYYGLAAVPLPAGGGTAEAASLLYLSRSLSLESSSLLLLFWRLIECYLLVALGSLALLKGAHSPSMRSSTTGREADS